MPAASAQYNSADHGSPVSSAGTVVEVTRREVEVVRVPPLAVITQVVPGTAVFGIVTVTVNPPLLLAFTVSVEIPHTLIVTELPGWYPCPLKVTVPPGGADPELEPRPPQFFEYAQVEAVW
jgi:hypothetical protein